MSKEMIGRFLAKPVRYARKNPINSMGILLGEVNLSAAVCGFIFDHGYILAIPILNTIWG